MPSYNKQTIERMLASHGVPDEYVKDILEELAMLRTIESTASELCSKRFSVVVDGGGKQVPRLISSLRTAIRRYAEKCRKL